GGVVLAVVAHEGGVQASRPARRLQHQARARASAHTGGGRANGDPLAATSARPLSQRPAVWLGCSPRRPLSCAPAALCRRGPWPRFCPPSSSTLRWWHCRREVASTSLSPP